MAGCETWVYRNVDGNVFKRLQGAAHQQGIVIPNQPSGQFKMKVSAFTIAFQYRLDPHSQILQLTCTDKPALLGCAMVKSYADKIIVASGGMPS